MLGSADNMVYLACLVILAGGLVAADVWMRRKPAAWISSIYFGLLLGTLLTAIIGYTLMPLLLSLTNDALISYNLMVILGITLCYLGISVLVQTQHDIRFIVPYVEFRREIVVNRLLILDISVLIDARIVVILETLVLTSELVVPPFVVEELQSLADSPDRSRRARGKRGLEVLSRLQKLKKISLRSEDIDMPDFQHTSVDLKLLELARHLGCTLITCDHNMSKIAKDYSVETINLSELANALKTAFLTGERLTVELIKPGEEAGQGVGYLDDGTMVVVEGGQTYIGEHVVITITSMLQTSAGRMIFGRYEKTSHPSDSGIITPLGGFVKK
jgi:uncharacterized protein YacL